MKKDEILSFINLFKSASPSLIEKIYLNGGCYRFHLILKVLYPEAIPYKVGYFKNAIEHVVTKIDDNFYDVKGIFKIENTQYKYIKPLEEKDIPIVETFRH